MISSFYLDKWVGDCSHSFADLLFCFYDDGQGGTEPPRLPRPNIINLPFVSLYVRGFFKHTDSLVYKTDFKENDEPGNKIFVHPNDSQTWHKKANSRACIIIGCLIFARKIIGNIMRISVIIQVNQYELQFDRR